MMLEQMNILGLLRKWGVSKDTRDTVISLTGRKNRAQKMLEWMESLDGRPTEEELLEKAESIWESERIVEEMEMDKILKRIEALISEEEKKNEHLSNQENT